MKEISVFDIIGPIMIGPSSSHTAGALRIASLASKLAKNKIVQVEFELFGSFAETYKGHGTDRALLSGIMGYTTRDPRVKDAFAHADKEGLKYSFIPNRDIVKPHPNTVAIRFVDELDNKTYVEGESIGGGSIVVTNINGIAISLTGNYNTIVIKQKDIPGVIAHISAALSEHTINIGTMNLHRESRGTIAYTIIETDENIPQEVVASILEDEDILDTVIIAV